MNKNDPDFVTEFLITTIGERREREELEKAKLEWEKGRLEREENQKQNAALELEKTKLELEKAKLENEKQIEIARIQAESRNLNGDRSSSPENRVRDNDTSLENIIKSIRTLTIPIPTKPKAWSLFFAFETKNVQKEYKAEILINLLGEKATNLLIYVKGEDINN